MESTKDKDKKESKEEVKLTKEEEEEAQKPPPTFVLVRYIPKSFKKAVCIKPVEIDVKKAQEHFNDFLSQLI